MSINSKQPARMFQFFVWATLIGLGSPSFGATITWMNGTGNWADPNAWSSGALPGPNDDVIIDVEGSVSITISGGARVIRSLTCTETLVLSGGILELAAPSEISGALIFSAGLLSGTGDLTITGAMDWSGGQMAAGARTIIENGATLVMTGETEKYLNRTLENGGIVNYTGTALRSGYAVFSTGTINNLPGGVFTVNGNGGFTGELAWGATGHAFNNAGRFNKSGADTTTTFNSFAFHNTGIVDFSAGTLTLNGGGSSSQIIPVAPGATLNLAGGFNFPAGGGLVGNGTVNFTSGTHTFAGNFAVSSPLTIFSGATLVFNAAQSFASLTLLPGGTLAGSGDVTITQIMDWSGGTMSAGGRTIIQEGATLTMSTANEKYLNRILENDGTVNYPGTGLRFWVCR
jgi:hypothetical protein